LSPVDAFSLWNLIRDCVDLLPEVTTIPLLRGDWKEIPKRETEIHTSPFVSPSDLNLHLLRSPLVVLRRMILILTLTSYPWRKRPNLWKRRLRSIMIFLL
jgi:hypothetical protein